MIINYIDMVIAINDKLFDLTDKKSHTFTEQLHN
jgi:hypothetical protein